MRAGALSAPFIVLSLVPGRLSINKEQMGEQIGCRDFSAHSENVEANQTVPAVLSLLLHKPQAPRQTRTSPLRSGGPASQGREGKERKHF